MRKNMLISSIIACFLPWMVQAQEWDYEAGGIYYTLSLAGGSGVSEATVVAGDVPYAGEVLIPDTVNVEGVDYVVRNIADKAFRDCPEVTTVRIPAGVQQAGYSLFADCTALRKVLYAAQNVYWSSINAFRDLPITTVVVEEGVLAITPRQFAGCRDLDSVRLAGSVRFLGRDAFEGTALYQDASNWQDGAFYVGDWLMEAPDPVCEDGVYEVRSGTTVIADGALEGCTSVREVVLPHTLKSIGEGAFGGCTGLTAVNIPESVEIIRECAFVGTDNLKRLDYNAVNCTMMTSFYTGTPIGWSALEEVRFGSQVEVIPDNFFRDCRRLQSVTIPSNVKRVLGYTFADCTSLATVELPSDVEFIGRNAFYNTAFYNDSANWDNGQLYLGDCLLEVSSSCSGRCEVRPGTRLMAAGAFYGRRDVTEVALPDGLRHMGHSAFYTCTGLRRCTIPEGVTEVPSFCFAFCGNLEHVSLPASLDTIRKDAFVFTGLKSIELPVGLEALENAAFALCDSLKTVKVHALMPPTVAENCFADCPPDMQVFVPMPSLPQYRAHEVWGRLNLQGMETAAADAVSADGWHVWTQGREIIVSGGHFPSISLYGMDGRCVYQGQDSRIAVPAPGVYLLRAGDKVVKVAVAL